jgi:hypothetical protein
LLVERGSTRIQAARNIFAGWRTWPKTLLDFASLKVRFTGIFA